MKNPISLKNFTIFFFACTILVSLCFMFYAGQGWTKDLDWWFGFLIFGGFAALPSIVGLKTVNAFDQNIICVGSFIMFAVTSALYYHTFFIASSDAQSALGFVVMPFLHFGFLFLLLVGSMAMKFLKNRSPKK